MRKGFQITQADCKNAKNHTPSPIGYIHHQDWAMRKLKTHESFQCPDCLYWVIWKKRESSGRRL